MLKISIRGEGGGGDLLLQNRFVPAIKEKYPDSEITLFIDSEGKTFQKEILEYLYSSFYKEIKIIPNKKYKEFYIDSQYGTENQKGFLPNVPDDIMVEMLSYDKFYDIHLDSLGWLSHDYDFVKYFRQFPKPEIRPENKYGDYLVSHLYSSTSVEHKMETWFVDRCVLGLDKLAGELNIKHYIIATPEINSLYDNVLKQTKNTIIFNSNIKDICDLIYHSKGFLGTDSGFRFIAYGCSIPTLSFSKYSNQPHSVQPSHFLRWNPLPETVFPLHHDCSYIIKILKNMLTNRVFMLLPFVTDNLDNVIIKRNYKVNLEKSILS